jgi:TonB-linked SusC/RagA family outer membrane protein
MVVGAVPLWAQSRTVAGRVIDAQSQQPIPNAQVVVGREPSAAALGARTDARGQFVIRGLPDSAVALRVVAIGYQPMTRQLAIGDASIVFTLNAVAVTLDRVVTTGTAGATRTREIGNSVAQIDAASVVETAPVSSVTQLLGGRVPGVNLMANSGSSGAGGKIQIRGVSSLSLSNEPLVYVDGVRIDNSSTSVNRIVSGVMSRINDISPEEIESIEVIKGPAAATLYGTEASNGVIQIITKKGAAGRVVVDVSMRHGTSWFSDAAERVGLLYGRTAGQVASTNTVANESDRGTPLFGNGELRNYSIGIGGGSQTVKGHMTTDLEESSGVFASNRGRRLSNHANLSFLPSDKVTASVSFGYLTGRTYQAQEQSLMWNLLYGGPQQTANRGFLQAPPESYESAFTTFQDIVRTTAGANVTYQPFSWLRNQFKVGTDLVGESSQQLVPRLPADQNFLGATGLGYKYNGQRNASHSTFDFITTVDKDIRPELNSKTSGGLQYFRKSVQFVQAEGFEFPAPGVTTVSSAARVLGSDSLVQNNTVGFFVQQQLGWKDRRFLTLAVRADDNSAFGKNYKVVYYPKASAAWVLSEESFWHVSAVDQLRLRVAYGASGRQPDAFAALQAWSPQTGPGDAPIVLPAFRGNADLEPERGEEIEAGFEAGMFDNKVSMDVTYYNKRTKNAILLRTLAPSMGFTRPQYVNVGEVRNNGFEALFTYRPIQTPSTSWDLSLNLASNKSHIVSMGGLPPVLFNQDFVQRNQEGYPIGSYFEKHIVSADLDANGRAINVLCDGGPAASNAAVPCAAAPRLYVGQPDPPLQGAFMSHVRFNRFEFALMTDFKRGHRVWNVDEWLRCTVFQNCEINFYPQRFDAKEVAAVQQGIHTYELQPGNFLAIREISATYRIPEQWLSRIGTPRGSISIAGRNLHKWTSYRGLDPEVGRSFYGSNLDWLNYALVPQLAQVTTTVRLGF